MESGSGVGDTTRNAYVQLTDAERAVIDSLNRTALATLAEVDGANEVARARKAIAEETRHVLGGLIPGFGDRSRAQSEQWKAAFEKLKGTAWPPPMHDEALDTPYSAPYSAPFVAGGLTTHVDLVTQPANAGELWWAETNSFVTAPDNTLFVDINAGEPYRIWGHIGYGGDALISGTVGLVMTFILSPDRYWRTGKTTFEVRPELRTGGVVSGWTGLYHPIWHADDKWSKCWHHFGATLTLSTGETLAADSLDQNIFFLDDVTPVGQASVSDFMGWGPVLRFNANLADLRQRGISMIFRVAFRYDFQLEGESDIWFRHRNGSASESVPMFDNALTFRCWPGIVTPV